MIVSTGCEAANLTAYLTRATTDVNLHQLESAGPGRKAPKMFQNDVLDPRFVCSLLQCLAIFAKDG